MKWILLTVLFEFSIYTNAQQIARQDLRECFLQSTERKSALDSFIKKLEAVAAKSPIEESYYGICCALNAQYVSGTWSKIKLVNQSRGLLNDAIAKAPNDPELRFMRLTLEHFLPSFLGMSRDIPADLNLIMSHPDFVSDNLPLKKKALQFLISTHRCSAEQNRILEGELTELNKNQSGYLALSTGR